MKALLIYDGKGETLLRQCLADQGAAVVVCRSLGEARERSTREPFDVVVVDIESTVAAEAFCAGLGKRLAHTRPFVLLGLAAGEAAQAAKMLAAGADDLLVRPYERRAVQVRLSAVERQIRLRHEWRQVEELLNTRAQQQVAIAALGQYALSEDLPTLFDLVSRFVMHTLDVEFCCLLVLGPDGASLEFVAGFGWKEGYIGRVLPNPPSDSVIGCTLLGEDLILGDLETDPRFGAADFLRDHGVVSGISVAVQGKEKGAVGVLGAYSARRREFLEDDLRFVEGLANVLGAAIERKRNEVEIQKHQAQVQHLQRLESVGQLAAGLAHDYNNVLTIIHGHVTLALGDADLPAHIAGSMKAVLLAVERAATLTRHLLSFSRTQAIDLQPVDLNGLVVNLAKLLDRVLGSRLRVEVQPGANLPAVNADPGMLDQILMNLAFNSRDAMPEGGTLRLATSLQHTVPGQPLRYSQAREGSFVCLTVSDTGCGMDESTLRRIFDPFFTTKEPGKGTGLGLSTAYGLVSQHQGWIEVESQVGQGTTFRVFLPSCGDPLPQTQPQPVEPIAGSNAETVLLVEDDPTLRESAALLLEDLGRQVLQAGSGTEAIQTWDQSKERIGILLTDLALPDGLTGFELAERLQGERPDLRVIFASGYSADAVHGKLSPERTFYFLQKPYNRESLGRAIGSCQAGKQAFDPVPPVPAAQ